MIYEKNHNLEESENLEAIQAQLKEIRSDLAVLPTFALNDGGLIVSDSI